MAAAVAVPALISLFGVGVQELNARSAARATTAAAYQNRKAGDVAAARAVDSGQQAEAAKRLEVRHLLGEQSAAFASSGVDLGGGSVSGVLESTAGLGELDAQTIRNNALREAWGLKVGGVNALTQGSLTASALKNQAASGIITTGATIAGNYYASKH